MKAVRARVYGRVQNVFYRANAQAEGERLGLHGWVMNVADGSVALHVQGSAESVDEMLDWCGAGPPAARVQRVEVIEAEPDDELLGFEVR